MLKRKSRCRQLLLLLLLTGLSPGRPTSLLLCSYIWLSLRLSFLLGWRLSGGTCHNCKNCLPSIEVSQLVLLQDQILFFGLFGGFDIVCWWWVFIVESFWVLSLSYCFCHIYIFIRRKFFLSWSLISTLSYNFEFLAPAFPWKKFSFFIKIFSLVEH